MTDFFLNKFTSFSRNLLIHSRPFFRNNIHYYTHLCLEKMIMHGIIYGKVEKFIWKALKEMKKITEHLSCFFDYNFFLIFIHFSLIFLNTFLHSLKLICYICLHFACTFFSYKLYNGLYSKLFTLCEFCVFECVSVLVDDSLNKLWTCLLKDSG